MVNQILERFDQRMGRNPHHYRPNFHFRSTSGSDSLQTLNYVVLVLRWKIDLPGLITVTEIVFALCQQGIVICFRINSELILDQHTCTCKARCLVHVQSKLEIEKKLALAEGQKYMQTCFWCRNLVQRQLKIFAKFCQIRQFSSNNFQSEIFALVG